MADKMRAVARSMGMDVYRHVAGGRRLPFLVRRLRAIGPMRPATGSFLVPLDPSTSFVGFSYHPDGWNPHVKTLHEFIANDSLTYEQSSLYRLHQQFQPTTLQELFLGDMEVPAGPLHRLPVARELFRYIWCLSPKSIAGPVRESRGHHYFGPLSKERGTHEFESLLRTYRSIRDRGFQPEAHGPVRGYFLADGDEYRFVVGSGNHRLAVLRVLGFTEFEAHINASHPAVIHRDELAMWGTEVGGPFEPGTAERLFDALFHGDGDAKARSLGIN